MGHRVKRDSGRKKKKILINFEKWQHVKTFNVIGVEVWCIFVKNFRRY